MRAHSSTIKKRLVYSKRGSFEGGIPILTGFALPRRATGRRNAGTIGMMETRWPAIIPADAGSSASIAGRRKRRGDGEKRAKRERPER